MSLVRARLCTWQVQSRVLDRVVVDLSMVEPEVGITFVAMTRVRDLRHLAFKHMLTVP